MMVPKSAMAATGRRRGRPPAGVRQGERVRAYPTLTLRMPPGARSYMEAVRQTLERPLWRIVDAAIRRYVEGLDKEWQRNVGKRFKRLERARKRRSV